MEGFKNINEARDYCTKNGILFSYKDNKAMIIKKIKQSEQFSSIKTSEGTKEEMIAIECEADGSINTLVSKKEETKIIGENTSIIKVTPIVDKKETVELKCFNAYEFGQLHRLDKSSIAYLTKKFGKEKDTYDNWIKVCKDNKVID